MKRDVCWVGVLALASSVALAACHDVAPDPGTDLDAAVDPGTGTDAAPSITVTLDGLQPGWLVTTSRLTDHDAPTDITQIADGASMTLTGTETDVFVTTITDADGVLVDTQAMQSTSCLSPTAHHLRVPAEYPTIQAAIDAAQPGDAVKVAAGTYTESVVMKANVCLLGTGGRRTILDAGGEARTLVDLTDAPGSVVAGFVLRGVRVPDGCANPSDVFACSGDWYRAAIYLGGTDWFDPTQFAPPVIFNNVFEDNEIAVMLYWRGVSVVRNNVFEGNRSALVANHFQSRTLVASNVFYLNASLAIGNQAAYLDIVNNILVGSDLAVRFMYIQTGFIQCNLFWSNGANANEDRFTIGASGNISASPIFVDAANHDFHLVPGSPGSNGGCHPQAFEPDGTAYDIGAHGGPLAAAVTL